MLRYHLSEALNTTALIISQRIVPSANSVHQTDMSMKPRKDDPGIIRLSTDTIMWMLYPNIKANQSDDKRMFPEGFLHKKGNHWVRLCLATASRVDKEVGKVDESTGGHSDDCRNDNMRFGPRLSLPKQEIQY